MNKYEPKSLQESELDRPDPGPERNTTITARVVRTVVVSMGAVEMLTLIEVLSATPRDMLTDAQNEVVREFVDRVRELG